MTPLSDGDDEDWDPDWTPFTFVPWIQRRATVTIRYLELDAEDPDVSPAADTGAPWYDCPYGTTDLEGGTP